MLDIKNKMASLRIWVREHDKPLMRTYYFFKALILDPKSMGAIVPSSDYLANTMASYIPLSQKGLVIELGAGTGVISEAILKRGIPPQQLIIIESSPDLVNDLRERFPNVKVIEDHAENLITLLKDQTQAITTILSSLPLRSLAPETTQGILAQIPRVLGKQGIYIQFTYDLRKDRTFYPPNYHLLTSEIVWKNIPPAKVEVYTFV